MTKSGVRSYSSPTESSEVSKKHQCCSWLQGGAASVCPRDQRARQTARALAAGDPCAQRMALQARSPPHAWGCWASPQALCAHHRPPSSWLPTAVDGNGTRIAPQPPDAHSHGARSRAILKAHAHFPAWPGRAARRFCASPPPQHPTAASRDLLKTFLVGLRFTAHV